MNRPFKSVPLALLLGLCSCSTTPTLGTSANFASGAAGGSTAANPNAQLEHCDASLGTLALVEDQGAMWFHQLRQNNLQSTVPVLRMIVQQSNCFVVVERGQAMNNLMQERALAASGESRGNSNMGKGQLVAADYTMSPSINFSQQGGSGVGGAMAGFVPVVGGLFAAAAASAKSNDASTTLLLVDNRSGVQLSASEGSASNTDFSGLFGAIGGGAGGAAGGYSTTPVGKVVTAAFVDSYNKMVRSLRDYRAQQVNGGLGAGGTLGVSGGTTPASKQIK